MSIEALLERVAVGLERVANNQEQLIAGQAAAIEKVEATKPKRETKAEKEAREAAEKAAAAPAEPSGNGEPVATATGAADASSASDVTDEMVKATAVAWTNTSTDVAEKTKKAEWLQKMVKTLLGLGDDAPMQFLTGPQSALTAEHRKKVVFFIKRAHKLKGMEHVDFNAAYDFDEAPDQDAPRVEAADFDPLG